MKIIIFAFSLTFSLFCGAQLPTIFATGGELKVNWDYRFKQNRENEYEYPFVYGLSLIHI